MRNNITIELKGNLSRFICTDLKTKVFNINLIKKYKVYDILKIIGIPKEYIALITINSSACSLDTEVKNKDKVIFYPPIGGG